MGENSSPFDFYKYFAKKTGREINCSEIPYPTVAMHKVTYHRRTLYIPDNSNKSSFFICFADSREMGPKALFSGVFMPLDLRKSTTVFITKKDILDKMNPFGKKKYCTTGITGFDSMVQVKSNECDYVKRIFQDRKTQKMVTEAFKLEGVINISINDVDLNFVPAFKDKSNIGIYTGQEWIEDKKTIEHLFSIANQYILG